jgi:tripartite-type tricarboxylate transporter receptor subunit TctC
LKANPDKASQGTIGAGSPHHVAGVFFQKETGTRFLFVPYRGAAPAMQALVAGQIELIIDSPTIAMPQVRAGTIKGYAVAAKSRLETAPDRPDCLGFTFRAGLVFGRRREPRRKSS